MKYYYKCPGCGENAAFSHHFCIKKGKEMKIPGLDGEWEHIGSANNWEKFNGEMIILKRIPEKSDLEKWIDPQEPSVTYRNGLTDGFRKAIEVLRAGKGQEQEHAPVERWVGYNGAIKLLKAYCGDK